MDNSDKQMKMLLEEGGIADDGMRVDPVSGNEIPPGSMASEVRDDIPAQLSEGEYVVPADVLRFYGVKFFEDLRAEAKMGLAGMEANGRIGGEPVEGPAMGGGEELTREEMAEIESIMMAVGGYVPQPTQSTQPDPYMQQQAMYNQGAPVAMGNSGYAEGGLEDGETADYLNPTFDPSMFQPGFSFLDDSSTEMSDIRTITMYGPNGEVEALTLPAQKDRYDELLSLGYSETPVETTTETTVGEEPEGRDNGFDPSSEDTQESVSVNSMTNDQLSANAKALGVISQLGKVALGPVASAALGTATAARYNDILDEMNFRGLDTTGMDRKGSIFGGEESLLGGLDDTNDDGKVDFGDTFLGDLLGLDGKFGVQGKGLKDSWKGGRRSGAPMDATDGANTTEGAQVGDTFGAEDLGGYTDNAGVEGGNDFGGNADNGDDFGDGMGIGGLYSKGGIVKRRSKKKKK